MKKILIVNGPNQICGVNEFARRMYDYCQELKDYEWAYTSDRNFNADCVIFNYHQGTMHWLHDALVNNLKQKKIKVGIIPHNKSYPNLSIFDFVLHDDCLVEDNGHEYGLPRVILPYDNEYAVGYDTIGFFGFVFPHKNLLGLAEKVSKEFVNPLLRIKSTPYPNHEGYFHQCINHIKQTCPNIRLEINTDYLDTYGIIEYLAQNSINCFPYLNHPDDRGQTAVLDFALAARRPICVSQSPLFNHVNKNEAILFEKNRLSDIIDRGLEPLAQYYDKWTKDKFLEKIDKCLKTHL